MMDDKVPGDIIARKLVAGDPFGARAEWQLLVQEDGTEAWQPKYINDKGEVESTPVWMPLPGSQFLFLQCPVFEALYQGTRGPGKTITLLMDYAKDVGKGFGNSWRGILFRREYKELDDVVKKIEEWFPLMFPGFRFLHSKAEYMAIWPSGESLLLRAGESEEVYKTFHGHEYPWIGFEELTQWEDDGLFRKMQSCCRSSKPGLPCRIRASTNPYGAGHNWVKKRYQLPQMEGKIIHEEGQMPRVAIHGSLYENFLLLHSQPNYVQILKNASNNVNEVKAWVEGDWNVTSGGMFDDLWDPMRHIIPDISFNNIPRGWSITRTYDHGQSHPFAALWWLESNGEPIKFSEGNFVGNVRGDLILLSEWYGTTGEPNTGVRMPSRKIGEGIRDRESDMGLRGRVMAGPADTEIFNKISDRDGRCPADDMGEYGITWERADKSPGSRKRGLEMIRSYLEGAKPNPDGSREFPGLFVCRRCVNWIELVPSAPRANDDPDEIPDKYEDHLIDSTRYRLNWEAPYMFRRGF